MRKRDTGTNQRGGVSLFIVIFSTLLITVLTLSFIRLMVRDQQQASDSDLSQSAYDSATSGVEDAKRALLRYQQLGCENDPTGSNACKQLTGAFNSGSCYTLQNTGIVGVPTASVETPIETTTSGSQTMNQAYTCVTVNMDTPNYVGTLKAGNSTIVPLTTADSLSSIELSWFTYDDFSGSVPSANRTVSLEANPNTPLYAAGGSKTNTWPKNRPSVVRAQLMQFADSGFTLSDFDNESGNKSDANTLFLYPLSVGATDTSFLNDTRRDSANSPVVVNCNPSSLLTRIYACTEKISLPDPINGGVSPNRKAYLRLSALYNDMHYQVKLINDKGAYTTFNDVQPSVDSTGRANDLFRRVQSRIDLTGTFSYPDAAVETAGNFCKNFLVTDNPSDYQNSCTP